MAKTLFVNGTLMRGFGLYPNLAKADYLGVFMTAPKYRIYSINDIHPGMHPVAEGGVAVEGELYVMSDETWAQVEAGEPPHLYCGDVELADGRVVDGILYPQAQIKPEHIDISSYGSWRSYRLAQGVIEAQPYPLVFHPHQTALIMIDMQRDFLEEGGFGALLGNDVSLLRSAIEPCQRLLAMARSKGLLIIHTREGHAPHMADCPPSKKKRGNLKIGIGAAGPMGRILIRGEAGHALIPELEPMANEVVLDKIGKGAFYATDLEAILRHRGITTLIVAGVTTEVCVHTTVREANDRGFECVVSSDATASYFPEFHRQALAMIQAQGGIFGWVANTQEICTALAPFKNKAAV